MRYELTDCEWIVIKPMLPNKPRGVPRLNDRRVLNGILGEVASAASTRWRALKAGTIAVNSVWGSNITIPFGGCKQSGIGRDKSLHAMDKCRQVKHIFIQF